MRRCHMLRFCDNGKHAPTEPGVGFPILHARRLWSTLCRMQSGPTSRLTLPETRVLQCVQRSIDDGRLPLVIPSLISASYGTGSARCVVCDLGILSDQVMYEIDDPRRVEELLPFHFGCYVIWQRECAQRLATRT